jgi:hypothetical protein
MIILAPIGLLLLAAIAILILDRVRPKFGTSWLIASGASVLAWLAVVFFRFRLPTTLAIMSWGESNLNLVCKISLLLDYDNWPYLLALVTILMAVLLTDAARTRYDTTPKSWVASLFITALGLLALQSGTSLTMMITWLIVDGFELFYLFGVKESRLFSRQIAQSYAVRIASILMLGVGTILGWQTVGCFPLSEIPQAASFFFLVAAGLRLGVLPLNLTILQEPSLRRGAGNLIRLAPVAASMSLLARLSNNPIMGNLMVWLPVIMILLAIAALYAAFRWLTASDEIEGRPFWIIAWSVLAIASVLNGAPKASLVWGSALLLPGSLLFLYFPRVQRMNFLLYLGLLGLVGFPYTPAASGWVGLTAGGVTFWTIVFILTHALLVLGYIKRIIQPGGAVGVLESWARLVYPLGLILIIQAIVVLGLIGWPGSWTLGTWWPGLISNGVVILLLILTRKKNHNAITIEIPSSTNMGKLIGKLLLWLERFFQLGWLSRFIALILGLFMRLLRAISFILESEGGILWTLLLFVLLISLLTGIGIN